MLEVTFRADAAPHIGAGHLMRCFALASAIRAAGGRVHLVASHPSPLHVKWVDELGASVHLDPRAEPGTEMDLRRTLDIVRATASNWLVIDTYAASTDWISRCAKSARTMLIDDLADRDAEVDVVLNQNAGAEERYASSYTRCSAAWLGTRWFLRGPQWDRQVHRPGGLRLLVTLGGGSDAIEFTHQIANALMRDRRTWSADIVMMGKPPNLPTDDSQHGLIVWHEGPVDLPSFMAKADVVICGGGVTSLEAMSMGVVPIVIALADNQRPGARSLRCKERPASLRLKLRRGQRWLDWRLTCSIIVRCRRGCAALVRH
jgi:UDP-2,4-diacetamido-2,4,6-trideoxy-beta-L-altropyranose hydrolase